MLYDNVFVILNRTFAEIKKPSYNCCRNKDMEVFSMKFRDIKRYLNMSKEEINRYISHVMVMKKGFTYNE